MPTAGVCVADHDDPNQDEIRLLYDVFSSEDDGQLRVRDFER